MAPRWLQTTGQSTGHESKAEFIARMGIAAEEADEAVHWLELLIESGIIKSEMTEGLLKEARELAAILTAWQQTAKRTA